MGSPHTVSTARPPPTYWVNISNEPTVESAKNGVEKFNDSNGRKFPISDHGLTPPMNLLGGGSHRFAGSLTPDRRRLLKAVIDTELGAPAAIANISADGVVSFRIPNRKSDVGIRGRGER
jgi:hypothetical protein